MCVKGHIRCRVGGTVLFAAIAAAATTTGCAPKYQDLKAFVQAHDHDVAATVYRVEPPDTLAISSPTSPEVDGVRATVGVNGKITIKMLGEVKVSGMTPREIGNKLEILLSRYYVDPVVHVRVGHHASKHIYVFGEVAGEGPQPFTGRDTVLDVLSRARPGFTAWGSQVKVIRPSPDEEERHQITIDIDHMMETGDLRANFLLQEGDIIYVPPTPLAWVGQQVQQILLPVNPVLRAYRTPLQADDATQEYVDR